MILKHAQESPAYQAYRGPVTTAIFDWAGLPPEDQAARLAQGAAP
jgi:hypothetical protein